MGTLFTNPDEANGAVIDSHNWYWSESLIKPYKAPVPQVFISKPEVTPRAVTSTQIVCGNCAGLAEQPRKTLLTEQGRCASCGGRSYVLASELEVARRVALALQTITTTIS